MLDYITKYWKQNVKKEKKVKENGGRVWGGEGDRGEKRDWVKRNY